MNDYRLHKRKLIVNLSVFLVLALASVILIIDGAASFTEQISVVALLLLVVIEILLVLGIAFIALRIISMAVNEFKSNQVIQEAELDSYEKEVEEKVKEADDLTFNLNRLSDDVGKNEDWEAFGTALLMGIGKQIEIITGVVYKLEKEEDIYKMVASYAYYSENRPKDFKAGEGLTGQVVLDNRALVLSEIPENYVDVVSGLGKHIPNNLVIMPIFKNNNVIGVVELATFKSFGESFVRRISEISEAFGNLAPVV